MRFSAATTLCILLCGITFHAQGQKKKGQDSCVETPHTVKLSPKVLKERAIQQVNPELPKDCNCEGKVTIGLMVDYDGSVYCTKYNEGSPLLKKAAINAARLWKFKPLRMSGVPVRYYGLLELTFTAGNKQAGV